MGKSASLKAKEVLHLCIATLLHERPARAGVSKAFRYPKEGGGCSSSP